MRKMIFMVIFATIGMVIYNKFGGNVSSKPEGPSVHIGATVEEVEQVWGSPLTVLPQFGDQLRTYRAKSGKKYTLIFGSDGKVLEIHE